MPAKSILYLLFAAILATSCTRYTYLQAPLTIEESIGQQNVLVETQDGKNLRFDYIEQKGDNYQGIKKGTYSPLAKDQVNAVYLRLDDVNKAWVYLRDGSMIKGYLYEVKDSSVVLAFGDRNIPHVAFPVNDIQKLNVRKNGSVRNGYLIGTGIGIGIGLALTAAIVAENGVGGGELFIGLGSAGLLGALGSVIGVISGGVAGHESFDINGSMVLFDYHRSDMEALSFEHEGYVEKQ
jgi:hypothetical protein